MALFVHKPHNFAKDTHNKLMAKKTKSQKCRNNFVLNTLTMFPISCSEIRAPIKLPDIIHFFFVL